MNDATAIWHGNPIFGCKNRFFLDYHGCSVIILFTVLDYTVVLFIIII